LFVPTLNINTDACVVFTDRLERLSRSALPVAVRQTLNNAAFDVKQRTLPESGRNNFVTRSPNFIKAFSRVDKAEGFSMNNMKAVVGMTDNGKASARTAVANMEKQEVGGKVDNGLDYLKSSRNGGTVNGRVRKVNYYDKSKVISGRSRVGRNRGSVKSKFVARAYRALKEGKPMFFNSIKGNYLMKVTSIRKTKKGKLKINSKLLIKDRKGEPATIGATHFTREAAEKTITRLPALFQKEAEKQYSRALRG
jgi:hypothetical protein